MVNETLYQEARQFAVNIHQQRLQGRIVRIVPATFKEKPYVVEDGISAWLKLLPLAAEQIAAFYDMSLKETVQATFSKVYIATWIEVYKSDLEMVWADMAYTVLRIGKTRSDLSPLTDEEIWLIALRTVTRYHELAMNLAALRIRIKNL